MGGSRETNTVLKLQYNYIYTLMKIKHNRQSKATYTYIQHSTTLLTQRNNRNFSTIAGRVSASPRKRHCRCWIPGQQERKVCRRIRKISGDHHRTAAVVTSARPLLLPSQQPRRQMKRSRHDWSLLNMIGWVPFDYSESAWCSKNTCKHRKNTGKTLQPAMCSVSAKNQNH